MSIILKGVGKINGDGWKDTTRVGEVVFVWNTELPEPYKPGQFPRIGCAGWSASTDQYNFTQASAEEAMAAVGDMLTERDQLREQNTMLDAKLAELEFNTVPLSAIRPIAVEAIRNVLGQADIDGNGLSLVEELERVATAAATVLERRTT